MDGGRMERWNDRRLKPEAEHPAPLHRLQTGPSMGPLDSQSPWEEAVIPGAVHAAVQGSGARPLLPGLECPDKLENRLGQPLPPALPTLQSE
jgi:hypothetical protein